MGFFEKDATTDEALRRIISFAIKRAGAERACVFIGKPKPKVMAYYGFNSGDLWTNGEITLDMLRYLVSRRRLKHALDTRQDLELKRFPSCCRSLLWVPIEDESSDEVVGYVYADHSEPGKLDHSARTRLGGVTEELGQAWAKLVPSPEGWGPLPSQPPPKRREPILAKLPWGKIGAFLMACLLATVAIYAVLPVPAEVKEAIAYADESAEVLFVDGSVRFFDIPLELVYPESHKIVTTLEEPKRMLRQKFARMEAEGKSLSRTTTILNHWRTGPSSLVTYVHQERAYAGQDGTYEQDLYFNWSWHKTRLGWKIYRVESRPEPDQGG